MATHDGYPEGWVRVVLMVSPDGRELHAIGGDREPGDGDRPYVGLDRILEAQPHVIAAFAKDESMVKLMNMPDDQKLNLSRI